MNRSVLKDLSKKQRFLTKWSKWSIKTNVIFRNTLFSKCSFVNGVNSVLLKMFVKACVDSAVYIVWWY